MTSNSHTKSTAVTGVWARNAGGESSLHEYRAMKGKPPSLPVWSLIAAAAFALLSAANANGAALDYAREILRDKPIAWWRFQDERTAEGVTARDSAANHDGIYYGRVTLEPGPARIGGKAVRFDGRSGHVSITDHRDFASERISVEFWLKSTQSWDRLQWPGSATLVTKATEGDGSGDWTINAGSREMGLNQGSWC